MKSSLEKIESDQVQSLVTKWSLQSVAREVVLDLSSVPHRIVNCGRTLLSGWTPDEAVQVVKSEGSYSYKGLMMCGSWSACPICAAKIAAHRQQEIERAITDWKGSVVHMTLTIPHYSGQSLEQVRDSFMAARRKMRAQKKLKRNPAFVPWSEIAHDYGIEGTITAFEVTYGENGWHYHCHELLFSKWNLDPTVYETLETFVKLAWEKACRDVHIDIENRFHFLCRSVRVDKADTSTSSYLSKFGSWGPSQELSLSHIKKGRQGSLTPWDFLRIIAENPGDTSIYRLYGRLFVEVVETFKGKNQIIFSKGFKTRLGLRELSDEQIVDLQEAESEVIGVISYRDWKIICVLGLRGYVLARLYMGYQLKDIIKTVNEISRGCNYDQVNKKAS